MRVYFVSFIYFLIFLGISLNSVKAQSDESKKVPNGQVFSSQKLLDLLDEFDSLENFDNNYNEFLSYFLSSDSSELNQILIEAKKKIKPDNYRAMAKLMYVQAHSLAFKYLNQEFYRILEISNDMVLLAYKSQDELLIGQTYRYFGIIAVTLQRYDLASTYSLTGVKIIEKIQPNLLGHVDYLTLSGILYEARNYSDAIVYGKKGLTGPRDKNTKDYNIYNTIGQSFKSLGELDSAKYYYAKSDEFCDLIQQKVWKYINLQNIGEIQFIEQELPLAKQTFKSVFSNGIKDVPEIAAKSQIWLAKINLLENQSDSALTLLNQSESILKNFEHKRLQTEYFLEDVYLTKLEVFKNQENLDSSFFYFNKYNSLHDSLEYLASLADRSVVQARIDNTEKTYALGLLQIQKKEAEQRRNAIIVSLMIFSAVGFTYFSWQKRRLIYQNKIAVLEKLAKESEVRIVKNQLKSFTNQLLEKAKLLEALESELYDKNQSDLRQEYLTQLNQSRILTDQDWSEFKSMFKKVYPGFFSRLKENFPSITPAEQRIASLIRLQFSAKEMAGIVGVSVDSVHKTRQRLRQRMELSSDINLEEFLLNF